jgi:hypothetical protein
VYDFIQTPLHVSGCVDPRNANRSDRSYQDLPVPKFKVSREFRMKSNILNQ